MKNLVLLSSLLFASVADAQVKMTVFVQGHKAGTATLSQRLTEKGGKLVELGMIIDSDDGTLTVRSDTTFDDKGAPVRVFEQTIKTGKNHSRREVIVSFDSEGANVVEDINGDRTTKHVPSEGSMTRSDPSEFWFVSDHPTVGMSVTALKFDAETLAWMPVTTTFRGVRPITVSGQRVIANVTDSQQGTSFVDDTGLPLRLEMTNAELERIWDKQ